MSAEIPPAIGDFTPGARVAGYRIEQLIGRGGMAVVYRATDVRLDRTVALKILNPELARDDSFRQRFIRESRAGAAVDHPHVIPVFEAGEAENVLFIAMRYVAGLDARALIERLGRLPVDRTVELITQVASALDTAHAAGLVHRDVKPANMLLASVNESSLNEDGLRADHVYLSDFGLSKYSVSSPSLTMTGQFLGTLDYMSPEQVNGRQIDGKTDQYALGCAAFEMLTGEPPFRREANMAVMWAQLSAPPPSVRPARPELSPRVDQVLGRALAKAPEDRYATCMEFALELREACAVAPGAVTPPVPPVRNPTELVAGASGPAAGAGIEPTQSRAVPGNGYSGGGAGYVPPGYGGPGYGGTPPPGYGQDGTQYGPWVAQYQGSGSGPLITDPVRPPRRGRGPLVLLGLLIVLVLVGSAVVVLHLQNSSNNNQAGGQGTHHAKGSTGTPNTGSSSPITTPSSTPTQTPTHPALPAGPAGTVVAFFRAINHHQYQRAWNLNTAAHSISDYGQFKAGYADTAHDTVTITGVSGNTVSVNLVAEQTDGTTKTFSGSYVVENGVIVQSSIQQTG